MEEFSVTTKQDKLFSGNALKLMAIITMFLDHFALVFFWQYLLPIVRYDYQNMKLYYALYIVYRVLRGLGRIAFPIFCFLIAEGFKHTRNPVKYFARLVIAAIISEVPFDLAVRKTWFTLEKQNVIFTLAAGLVAIFLWSDIIGGDRNKSPLIRFKEAPLASKLGAFGTVILMSLICFEMRTDYCKFGVLIIFTFYFLWDVPIAMFIGVGALLVASSWKWEIPALLAFFPIYFYNGKISSRETNERTDKVIRVLFYLFYPVHLLLLGLMRILLYSRLK